MEQLHVGLLVQEAVEFGIVQREGVLVVTGVDLEGLVLDLLFLEFLALLGHILLKVFEFLLLPFYLAQLVLLPLFFDQSAAFIFLSSDPFVFVFLFSHFFFKSSVFFFLC